MRTPLRASTLAIAVLGSVSFATAQNAPGDMQEKLNLNQSKERQVTQGLSREQPQSAAGIKDSPPRKGCRAGSIYRRAFYERRMAAIWKILS